MPRQDTAPAPTGATLSDNMPDGATLAGLNAELDWLTDWGEAIRELSLAADGSSSGRPWVSEIASRVSVIAEDFDDRIALVEKWIGAMS